MKLRFVAVTVSALLAFIGQSPAGLIEFTGVIDDVRISPSDKPFGIGDPFSATFRFVGPPNPSGNFQRAITRFTVRLGDFVFRGSAEGSLSVQLDVSQTNLLYQVFRAFSPRVPAPYSSSDTDILLYDPAVGGVVPPFDQLSINFFDVALFSPEFESDFASGHLTSFPVIRATPGPSVGETEYSLALFGLAIFALFFAARPRYTRLGM